MGEHQQAQRSRIPLSAFGAYLRTGGTDRRATDDGGHYIARRFDGPTDAFNHFAQNANFNRGGYRALEDQWAKATREGKRVFVRTRRPMTDRRSAQNRSVSGSRSEAAPRELIFLMIDEEARWQAMRSNIA